MDRDELQALVETGSSIAEIATALDRSRATVRHWLGRYGLRTRGSAGRPSRDGVEKAREAGLPEAAIVCPAHGVSRHIRDSRGTYRCKRCRADAVMRRRRKVKQILVAEAGGRCMLCGYDRCVAALELHHLLPEQKSLALSGGGVARSLEKARAETKRCVLLCSNCHAEVEARFARLS